MNLRNSDQTTTARCTTRFALSVELIAVFALSPAGPSKPDDRSFAAFVFSKRPNVIDARAKCHRFRLSDAA